MNPNQTKYSQIPIKFLFWDNAVQDEAAAKVIADELQLLGLNVTNVNDVFIYAELPAEKLQTIFPEIVMSFLTRDKLTRDELEEMLNNELQDKEVPSFLVGDHRTIYITSLNTSITFKEEFENIRIGWDMTKVVFF